VKPDQVNIVSFAVFGDFEQIDDPQEARFPRQLGSDIGKTYLRDGIYLNLAFLHAIAAAYLDMRARPDADAASDLSPANSIAEAFGEDHLTAFL